MEKYNHLKKYIDFTWHIIYPLEREALHAQIISDHFVNKHKTTNPTIIFTGGCYGAGKGHTIRYLDSIGKIKLDDFVYVDPDKIRTKFPEYQTLLDVSQEEMGEITSREAGYIVELIEYYALENNYNIIIDGSLKDWKWHVPHFELINQSFSQFQIIVIFVVASLETIIKRNCKRCSELSIINTIKQLDEAYREYSKIISKCYQVRNFTNDHDQDFFEDINKININEKN
jgi:hypothetical protein